MRLWNTLDAVPEPESLLSANSLSWLAVGLAVLVIVAIAAAGVAFWKNRH